MIETASQLILAARAHIPAEVRPTGSKASIDRLLQLCIDGLLPFVRILDGLERDRLPGALTLAISTPLISMLDDQASMAAIAAFLDDPAESWRQRRGTVDDCWQPLVDWQVESWAQLRTTFLNHDRRIADALRTHAQSGRLELITSPGMHSVLPLVHHHELRRAHVRMALDAFRRRFATGPRGLWLPGCAWNPDLGRLLLEDGALAYTFVSATAIARSPNPEHLGPVCTPEGLTLFPIDPRSTRELATGFSSDTAYRRPARRPGPATGLLDRADGDTAIAPWDPTQAGHRATNDAYAFLANRLVAFERMEEAGGLAPILTTCFDLARFGPGWVEGPWLLDAVVRHAGDFSIEVTGPSTVLGTGLELPVTRAVESSIGRGGYYAEWLDETNAWAHRYLHHAEQRVLEAAAGIADAAPPETARAAAQTVRELLLVETADCLEATAHGRDGAAARARLLDHLGALHQLADQVAERSIDEAFLAQREHRCVPFPEADTAAILSWLGVNEPRAHD